MQFELKVGKNKFRTIRLSRNWFTGAMTITLDGRQVIRKSALNPGTHFSLKLTRSYEFDIEGDEPHSIRIEKIRPRLLAGLRRQIYRVFVDGKLENQYSGY